MVMGFLRGLGPAAMVGLVAALAGAVVLFIGLILEGNTEGSGGGLRAAGGLLIVGGLVLVFFRDSRRRASTVEAAKGIYARYMRRTAHWSWYDRYGVAGVVLGLFWLLPTLLIQIVIGNSFGIMAVGIVLFWGGFILLIFGRIYEFRRKSSHSQTRHKPRDRRK